MDDYQDERFVNITINENITYSPELKYLIGAVACFIVLFFCLVAAVFLVAMEQNSYYSPIDDSYYKFKLNSNPKIIVSDELFSANKDIIFKFSIDNDLSYNIKDKDEYNSIIIKDLNQYSTNFISIGGIIVFDKDINSLILYTRDKENLNELLNLISAKSNNIALLKLNVNGEEVFFKI